MSKKSAGLLLFRDILGYLEVLLVHPGGPLWAGKDEGIWSIPKGEFGKDEEPERLQDVDTFICRFERNCL